LLILPVEQLATVEDIAGTAGVANIAALMADDQVQLHFLEITI
jgi:hypothetical protein